MSKKILILPGDGIGPEIVDEAVKVLACLRDNYGLDIDMDEALVGGAAIDATGGPLPEATLELAREYGLPIRAPFGDDLEEMAPTFARQNGLPSWLVRFMGAYYRRRVDGSGIGRPNAFIQHFSMPGNRSPDYLLAVLDGLRDGWTTELLAHPGYDGGWREEDLRALHDPRVRERLTQPDIELVTFRDLGAGGARPDLAGVMGHEDRRV